MKTYQKSIFWIQKYKIEVETASKFESEQWTEYKMETLIEKANAFVRLYDNKTGLWKVVKQDKEAIRSLSIIEETLMKLGLSKNETKVYLFLARTGEKKASEISEALSLHRTETYRILRDLEKRGLVSSVFEKPLKFIATPFERAIDVLIETKKLKLKMLEQKKERLLEAWLSIPQPEFEIEKKEVFQILEGDEQIDLKANEILSRTEDMLCIFLTEDDVSKLYHSGFLDKLERISKKGISVKLLAVDSPKSVFFIEKMKLESVEYRLIEVEDVPFFLISDKEELLFLLKRNGSKILDEKRKKIRATALWTNYEVLTRALYRLFAELWNMKAKEKVKVKAK
ncbi:hypothetical protein DRO54_03215 [Candidatus Bathyarchaeota archaeon]|nr:MAG: hypothetical protein DRO54_03215 [Candidatus Bathyarchaeota archaeon]